MGANIPLPALQVQGPGDPTEAISRLMQMKMMMDRQQLLPGELQEQQQRIQSNAQDMAARKALNDAYASATTKDANGNLAFDTDKLQSALATGPAAYKTPEVMEGLTKFHKTKVDLQNSIQDLQTKETDMLGGAAAAVKAAGYDPTLAHSLLDSLPQNPHLNTIRGTIDGDPAAFKQMIDSAIAQSPKQREVAAQEMAAQARKTAADASAGKSAPLNPQEVFNLNKSLTDRFQVLNPGQPLPPQYTVPGNATPQDYQRIDKALENVEKAQGVKAQQDTANATRSQAAALAAQNAADREEKLGHEPVTGQDASGRDVLVSAADAKTMGLTGTMKADADVVNKSHAARTWLNLASKQAPEGSPADQMGIMQLIDKMDKEGKLGPIASRWNDFLAGKVGAGDPDYAALRAKMGLSSTKLMQAHVGSRGGAFMLEHFEDLANAGKMDGPTLKAGVSSELDYMKDVAMLPAGKGPAGAGPQGGTAPKIQIGQTATHQDGSQWRFRGGDSTDIKNWQRIK